MDRRSRITLDDPAFRGRLRGTRIAPIYSRPHAINPAIGGYNDVRVAPKPVEQKIVVALVQKPVIQKTTNRPPSAVAQPLQKLVFSGLPAPRPHMPKQSKSQVLKRHVLKKTAMMKRPKHPRPITPVLLSGMAVMLFLIGAGVAFSAFRTNQEVKAQVKGLTTSQASNDGTTDSTPSETDPPLNIGSYSVAPDMARLLTITKIGVKARVIRVGVNSFNVMKTPGNIFDVGWYDSSAKPGENGTVVINGHVSGPTKHGVFYDIGKLSKGDKISIERGDHKVFTYDVTGTQVYDWDKVDMPRLLTTSIPGKPGLNLITCTGKFNVRANNFEQRVVVFAVQE